MYTSKDDGVYGEGEEVALYVVYSNPMDVLGTPTIPLNSGGEASFTLGGRKQVCFCRERKEDADNSPPKK